MQQRSRQNAPVMQLSPGRVSLYCGIGVLTGVLGNRILLTPLDSLAMTQSRSDILGIITGTALLLYGVGKAEVNERKQAVEMDGQEVKQGFDSNNLFTSEIEWAATAVMDGIPNIKSVAWVNLDRQKPSYFLGRFKNESVDVRVPEDGVIMTATRSGKRAYLADMKVVPVKEVEFGFLPSRCQVSFP